MLHKLWSELRYAVRSLGRTPGLAAAVIIVIALGVGVNTGIFSVINGVLFRDLPAPDANQLVAIHQTIDGVPDRVDPAALGLVSTTEYEAYRDRSRSLSGIMGYSGDPVGATLGGEAPQPTQGLLVTCNYFDVLEQAPVVGRALRAGDCRDGADPVVVLGHALWTAAFSADPAIVGRTIDLNRQLLTVVGVAREGTYGGMFRAGFFVPFSLEPLLAPNEDNYETDRSWLALIGRRNDGVGTGQVRAELAAIATQIDLEQPGRSTTLNVERAKSQTLPPFVRGQAVGGAAVLMAAFGLILLIACANVANLLLARGMARSRDFAVRLSLGASRAIVIRQLLIESVLLAIAGGAFGSLLAFWSFQALLALAIPTIMPVGLPPLAIDASPDTRVLIVTLALTLATGVLFGLAPALRASRTDLHSVMKQDAAGAVGNRSGARLQGTLLGAQVALCMVLIIGAGLLLRGLYAARTVDPGFDVGSVTVLSYDYVEDTGHGDDPAFWQRLRDDIAAVPGVEAAAYAAREPLGDDFAYTAIRRPTQDRNDLKRAVPNVVGPGYFSVLGLPVVLGRAFTDADAASDVRVVIISESTARNLWGDMDPIGRSLIRRVGFGPDQEVELRIVGVVQDAQVRALGEIDPYYLYFPARDAEKLLVRSRLDFAATAAAIRGAVRRLDPNLPAPMYPLESNLVRWQSISGLVTTLAGALGGLALVLAAVGIYAVVSYFVGRRFREIGIRLALGAGAVSVYRLILSRTMRPVAVGAAIGVAGAVAVSGILSSVLFGVSPLDPLGLGGAALLVIGIAFAAGTGAARRAARFDPVVTLRHE